MSETASDTPDTIAVRLTVPTPRAVVAGAKCRLLAGERHHRYGRSDRQLASSPEYEKKRTNALYLSSW